ncbi:MAG: redoxin domain-containing protein [Isosphaeraceae bacterium]|nr:redoxin domain-containing protein [Isosphaeraceae bacterium]
MPPRRFAWSWPRLAGLCAVLLLAGVARVESGEPSPVAGRELRGPEGRKVALEAPKGGATALVFYSTECPISNAYSPTLNALAAEFPAARLKLVGVCVDPDLSDAEVARHAKEYDLKFPVACDRRGTLARKLGVKVTPEAVVLDDRGQVRYRGRIDDQFARRGVKTTHPETHELRDAIAAILDGRDCPCEGPEAVGCPLPEAPEAKRAPTYARDVVRILQRNCLECHRKGQIGPFPLETFEQARKRAGDIVTVVETRRMPPWKPVPGFGPGFQHDRSLNPEEVETLIAWAENGAPEGDPGDLPPPPQFRDDWKLGTPDLVIEMPVEYHVPASGGDIYRCFVIPTSLPKDMYISGIEYKPGNPRVVHHIIGYVDTSGEARQRDAQDRDPGYMCFGGPQVEIHNELGGWAPGVEASVLPDGVGRPLPKGADVIMQVHYHPDGKPETDRSKIGLHFAKKPVKQAFHWGAALNTRFRLKPGASNQEVRAYWELPTDVQALSVAPHMHLLGKDMTMRAKLPDGTIKDLIQIDDWDFQWQNQYYYKEPIDLPKGTILEVVAHFDNSEQNPRNPNKPPQEVGWGEATTDEMCIGFIGLVKKGQDLTQPGATDDLLEIFKQQRKELQEKMKKERERARKASPSDEEASKRP